ncbi:MAG TPA: tripartite tricarboxylate transporter substrate binding protein [Burkholderiales bacterium]|nr:tripartite tricarboxylate transporter substrate binding protein [Burkholderiales bacterium]
MLKLVLRAAAFTAALVVTPLACAAEPRSYPVKPVRLLVGFAPGGGVDQTARILSAKLNEIWHQPLVIDNRSGAGGTIATDIAAKAAPDGYSLLFCGIWSHGVAPALYKSLPYDHYRDFAPVTMFGTTPNVLVVNPTVPAKSVSEFLGYLKTNGGKTTIASPGVGSSPHMTMELFRLTSGAEFVHVPYKGSAPALVDLLGGHIPAMFDNMTTQLALMKSGRTRPLAVTSPKRTVHLPDVPTMRESGVAIEVTVWYGLCAPSAVPKPILARLNADFHRALNAPDTQKKLVEIGVDVTPTTPEQFADFIRRETETWKRVVREAKVPQQTF